MIDLRQHPEPIVAFVGAGASMLPPSRLPSWFEFNSLLLECLCEKVADYSGGRQPTSEILSAFRDRRDTTGFFPPDFQAQLMEEEVGPDYFRVWQSLDTTAFGPVHAGLAELAAQGRLAAIITTNFDRLVETALAGRGLAFTVYHDQAGFEGLAARDLFADDGVLPVIKLHGSIEDPASLVDTLKQRVVGRPASLTGVLRKLLQRYTWLYLGFSGADFNYDPGYLGVLDAASDAQGFVFLARSGSIVQPGVSQIAQAYGERASIVHGDLSNWLPTHFGFAEPALPASPDVFDGDSAVVKARIKQWVDALGALASVNILCAMLRCSGMDAHAHWLLRKTWRSYRSAEDTQGKTYARYNYNYGLSLFEAGFISNPIARTDDNLSEWKEHADQNAYEFFGRSYMEGKLIAAGGHMAAALAYRGEVGKAIALAARMTDEALASDSKVDYCDMAMACVPIYDIVRYFEPVAAQLYRCVTLAGALGDEPRRAMLSAHLGRFLSYSGHHVEADAFLGDAERIARRLGLQDTLLAAMAARGRWLTDSGTSDQQAVQLLQAVIETIRELDEAPLFSKVDLSQPGSAPVEVRKQRPAMCRIQLDLLRSAWLAGDMEVVRRAQASLGELVSAFGGYSPHYYLSCAECFHVAGTQEHRALVPELVRAAREAGKASGNPWVDQAADRFEEQVGTAARS